MRKHFLILMLLTLLPLAGWADGINWTENHAPQVKENLTYDGTGQGLLTAEPQVTSGTINYAVTAATVTETPTIEGAYASVEATDAGDYKVWFKVGEDVEFLQVSIANAAQEVDWSNNGTSFNYGTENPTLPTLTVTKGNTVGDVTYTYKKEGAEGDFGAAPAEWSVGKWFVKASVAAVANYNAYESDGTHYFTVNKVASSVTTAPARVSETLTYNGELQALFTTNGAATGGTLYYAVTAHAAGAPAINAANTWYSEVTNNALKRSAAGTYDLYYYVQGDGTHTDLANEGKGIAVANTSIEIIPSTITVTTPAELNANTNWTGSPIQVIKTGLTASGKGDLTTYYAVSTQNTAPNPDAVDVWYTNISDAHLKVTAANTYYAYYKVESNDANVARKTPAEPIGTFVVNKVDASISVDPIAKVLTYDGTPQALVTAGTPVGGTMQYKLGEGEWSNEIPTFTNANVEQTVYFRVKGDGDHNDFEPTTGTPAAPKSVKVTIAKKILTAWPEPITTYYGDLKKADTDRITIKYDGFVDGENETNAAGFVAPTASFASDIHTYKHATDYYLYAGTYDEGLVLNDNNAQANNYVIYASNGKLVINPRKVKLVLKKGPANAAYGSKEAEATEWEIKKSAASTHLKVYLQNAADGYSAVDSVARIKDYVVTSGTGAAEILGTLKMKRTSTSTAVGNYPVSLDGGAAKTNYQLVLAALTGADAPKFVIGTVEITVKAASKIKTYGVADPEFTYTVFETADATKEATLTDAQKAAVDAAIARANKSENVGNYAITFGDLKHDQWTGYDITFKAGNLQIKKAPLTITAQPQTLYIGNTVAKLGQTKDTNYTVEGLVNNAGLGIADNAVVKLVFGTEDVATEGEEQSLVPVSAEEATKGQLTTAGTYNYGIVVELTNIDDLADNYDIKLVNGALKVIDVNTGIVLNFALDNTDAISNADGKSIPVTMGTKTMVKDNWHTMVLPFATSPFELSQVLGQYVVVNRLSDKSTASHVAFELELNEIPAGEAFLIKSGADIKWNGQVFEGVDGDDLDTDPDGKLISKNISTESKGGNKIVGVYATTSIQSTDAQMVSWLGNTAQKKADGTARENKWYEPYSAAKDIAPFEAYLMYAPNVAARPLITVQDADGTVTAISEVKAGEFQAIKTDGWYTINGVKLEGAPTEKGIYINNGKKIVVK